MIEIAENNSEVRAVLSIFEKGKAELGKIIAGQTELIEQAILTFLCGGHALVEGVPGVAKTMTVKTLARFLALDFRRIQGTPDMMPADILGTSVFSLKTSEFTFHRGPVFTQFLLADEINRMPPRTQAALLESMEERQVTIDGITHTLDDFFTVFATQNPSSSKAPTRSLKRNSTASSSRFASTTPAPPKSAPSSNATTPKPTRLNSNLSKSPPSLRRNSPQRAANSAPSASSPPSSITFLL
jgi:Mg-chelatase subunit ChlI